jgi:hypothetical protein
MALWSWTSFKRRPFQCRRRKKKNARKGAGNSRSVRRVRALQDVLLPELESNMNEIEIQLEELERDEVLGARWQPSGGAYSGH